MRDLTGILKTLPLRAIHVASDRVRKDFGDLVGLGNDIAANGLYNPLLLLNLRLAGLASIEGKDFLLLAGERRFRAIETYRAANPDAIPAHMKEVPCYVYGHHLTAKEILVIEWNENFHRKDFDFMEQAQMRDRLHGQLVEMARREGQVHEQLHTANMLGVSAGVVSQDLKLAAALANPRTKQIVEEAKGKKEALLALRQHEIKLAREILASRERRRAEEGLAEDPKALDMKRYVVSSFEAGIATVPDKSVDIFELDPDYGIDFSKTGPEGGRDGRPNMEEYVEIPPEEYEETLRSYLRLIEPKCKEHCWLLLWFSIRWYKETRDILREFGWKVPDLHALWLKTTGNSATPAFQLGNLQEFFFYGRKGIPRLSKMGRDNVFQFRTPSINERSHPAEKPIELYEEIFSTFALSGQRLVVGFAGSGNALIASANLKIDSIGFDLSQANKDKYDLRIASDQRKTYK